MDIVVFSVTRWAWNVPAYCQALFRLNMPRPICIQASYTAGASARAIADGIQQRPGTYAYIHRCDGWVLLLLTWTRHACSCWQTFNVGLRWHRAWYIRLSSR